MTDETTPSPEVTAAESVGSSILTPTKFLVCVDDSEASRVSLRFACIKAKKRGGLVDLLHVVQPADFQSLMGIADRMREEAKQKAEALLEKLSAEARELTGITPTILLREGAIGEEVLKAVVEDHGVNMLVLGVTPGPTRGKLIAWIASQMGEQLLIPIMLVPGNLTDQQIDELS